jgi:hypothetical protein
MITMGPRQAQPTRSIQEPAPQDLIVEYSRKVYHKNDSGTTAATMMTKTGAGTAGIRTVISAGPDMTIVQVARIQNDSGTTAGTTKTGSRTAGIGVGE